MAKSKAPLFREHTEGHGDETQKSLSVKKGTFLQVGSAVPQTVSSYHNPISVNKKEGTPSGGMSI